MTRVYLANLICPVTGKAFGGSVRPDIMLGHLDMNEGRKIGVKYPLAMRQFSEWVPVYCQYCDTEHDVEITISIWVEPVHADDPKFGTAKSKRRD